jgi:hypothetical protein
LLKRSLLSDKAILERIDLVLRAISADGASCIKVSEGNHDK